MKCSKCGAETKLAWDSSWFKFDKTNYSDKRDLCTDCGIKVLEWIKAGPEKVDLELVRRPRP